MMVVTEIVALTINTIKKKLNDILIIVVIMNIDNGDNDKD